MTDLFKTESVPPIASIEGEAKGWVPVDYLDEVCPPCRPTPTDWLVAGDVLRLASPDDDEGEPGPAVREGDVVAFSELTDFPSVRAVWNGPGRYLLLSPVPPGASLFQLSFDPDTLGNSIEEFMETNGANGVFEPGETFDITAYDWSDTSFVLCDGRFVEAENGAEAAYG